MTLSSGTRTHDQGIRSALLFAVTIPKNYGFPFFDQCVYQFRHREFPPLWDLNPHTLTDSGFACFLAVRNPFCRDTRIRTWDPLLPKQMRYRAALHPEMWAGSEAFCPPGPSVWKSFQGLKTLCFPLHSIEILLRTHITMLTARSRSFIKIAHPWETIGYSYLA